MILDAKLGTAAVVLAVLFAPNSASSQTFVELANGAQGMTPLHYKLLVDSAAAYYGRNEWNAAAKAYQAAATAYPWDPAVWHGAGLSFMNAGAHAEAAKAFSRAHQLGTPITGRWATGYAAIEYARANQPDSALTWLERAVIDFKIEAPATLWEDSAFTSLHSDPRYRDIAPPDTTGLSVVEGRRLDVDFLLQQMARFNDAKPPIPDSVVAAAAALKQRIGSLTSMQVVLEMQRLVAMMGRGHNGLIFGSTYGSLQPAPFPVRGYLFSKDIHIHRTDSAHMDLLGARVDSVEGVPTARLLLMLGSLIPAEGETKRAHTAELLLLPEVLHALGVAKQSDRLRLNVLDWNHRRRNVSIVGGRNINSGYNPPATITTAPRPLYQTRLSEMYWFEPLPADSALYVRFASVANRPRSDETLAEFGRSVRSYLANHPEVRNLVVDVRGNGGGNTYLYTELLRSVIAFDAAEGHHTFVLTDRHTYSAGMNFAIDADRLTNATFVGEATGGSVEQHGNASILRLPYSGRIFVVSSAIWNISSPSDDRRWIAPDVPVELTASDYFMNRDPVMDVVRALIRNAH